MNRKEFLLLSVLIFLTVIVWLIAEIQHTSTELKTKDTVTIPQIKRYDINKDVFDSLEERRE